MLGDLQQIDDALEAGGTGQLRRDVRQLDRQDRVDLDLALLYPVAAAHLDVRAHPDPDAARDRPAPHAVAEPLVELHAPSLRRESVVLISVEDPERFGRARAHEPEPLVEADGSSIRD